MRILFLPPYSLPVASGGFESQVYHIYDMLKKKGVDVHWFSYDYIDVRSFDIIHLWSTDTSMIPTARIFRNQGIPVVITPMAGSQKYSNNVHNLFNVLSNIPLVCQDERSIRFLYGLIDYFFPLTPFEQKRLQTVYSIKSSQMSMIPNGIDDSFFSERIDNVNLPFENYIISIGRIEPNKNQLSLIRAVNKLKRNLIIVGGDGFDKNYIQQCKQESGDNVYYWGLERNPYILKCLYKQAGITVIPSLSEMAPLVAFESVAMGTPVLCTKNCGLLGGDYKNIKFTRVDTNHLIAGLSNFKEEEKLVDKSGVYCWGDIADFYIESYLKVISKNAVNK